MGKKALQVYTLEAQEEWDRIVRSFASYDVYYLSGYVKAFHIHGDGEPLLFYFNDGKLRGINVAMKRTIMEDPHFKGILDDDRYYDLATPYGYGGWLIEADAPSEVDGIPEGNCAGFHGNDVRHTEGRAFGVSMDFLFSDYERWCLRNNIVSEFVRFHPMIGNHALMYARYDVIQMGEVVHMTLDSPEMIWENISSKNRNVIRKAIKNGVKVYNGRYPGILNDFRKIYDSTMDKDDAEAYYYFEQPFYDAILEELPENAQVFWAEKDGAVIAASIMLECNGFMNYHLSGSLREYSSLAPTNLLLYKAAMWGYAHGLKTLYLGGGVGSGEDSLFKFKRAFYKGDDLHCYYIGRKVFDPDVYKQLTMMRGESINRANFFPVYRG